MSNPVNDEILEKIKSRFLSKEIIDEIWFRHLKGKIWREESISRRKNEVLSFLNGSRSMHYVNHYILQHLATFCFNYYNEFHSLVEISGVDFNDLAVEYLQRSELITLRPEQIHLINVFQGSYSWLMGNQGKPVIYYNTHKLNVEKEMGSGSFRLAAWLLHEISHIILHWVHFEKDGNFSWKSLVNLKSSVSGAKLEEDAWDGAVQLLDVFKDYGLISEFNNDNPFYDKVVEDIFMKYKAEDVKRATK